MSLSHGETVIEVSGEVYELRPTLGALKRINKTFGGLRGALEALQGLNTEAIATIIVAGADLSIKDMKEVEENVFTHGVAEVTELVFPFVESLFNPSGKEAKKGNGKKAE